MRPKIEDDRKKLKIRNFRMADEDFEMLESYFQEKRIPVGTGIRMILIGKLKEDEFLN